MKDIFVVFSSAADIKGDTTDDKHKTDKAIEVSAWRHQITQPELFGLKYSAVKWTYTTAKIEGGGGVAGAIGAWNLKNNTPVFA